MPLIAVSIVALAALGTTTSAEPTITVEPPAASLSPPAASPTTVPDPTPSPTPSPSSSPPPAPEPAVTRPGWTVATGESLAGTEGRTWRYIVEVEHGLGIDADAFAAVVDTTLADPRSWTGTGSLRLERVAAGRVDFRISLASPATVDRECLPLRTGGWLSCWNGHRAMLNADRWSDGAVTWDDNLDGYRRYLVNHEVGHALGHDHVGCPGTVQRAPVMLQQTKSLHGCVANPWPYPEDEPTSEPSPAPDASPAPGASPTGDTPESETASDTPSRATDATS